MIEEMVVPDERKPILIGRRGKVLKDLRKETRTLISVKDDIISIEGEALNVWNAKNVISAIIHGFSPKRAFSILEGRIFETIDLTQYLPKARLSVIRSRIIGRNGRTRELLEEFTGSSISVEEKTLSVICDEDQIGRLREALEMFINGYSHRIVYKYLERGE